MNSSQNWKSCKILEIQVLNIIINNGKSYHGHNFSLDLHIIPKIKLAHLYIVIHHTYVLANIHINLIYPALDSWKYVYKIYWIS
jgi:hypothetical protein